MIMNQKSTENMTCTEIFQEICKRQILALMFHDHMRDLYDFMNLPGFKCWHYHQYMSESEEFLATKHYFMSTHNKLLYVGDTGQPESVIPESWYKYTRLDVNAQTLKQYVEASFDSYKTWEEDTKHLYEECAKALMDMGNVADAEMVNRLIKDVTCELKMIYKIMLKLRTAGYDPIYILDIQHWLHKKYK